MSDTHEKKFEVELCEHLAADGWLYSENDKGYDKTRALFPEDVFAWLEDTQSEQLAKLVKPTTDAATQARVRDKILDRLAAELSKPAPLGTLEVLRNGFRDTPASFDMMATAPSFVTEVTAERFAKNRLRVMRQVRYSVKHGNSIDLVLFVNGIPVATLELKTDFTQTVKDAKNQYRHDRNPAGEPLLAWGRCVVHFAVSNDEVYMTTRLAGPDTYFLPFNRGHDGHAGNGPDEDCKSPTTYLWRDVLQRGQWLDILGKFVHYETIRKPDQQGRTQKSTTLIFPRYHQLDAVTKIVADARMKGVGQRYLIQHSAGSGKTRSIAWSAHRLATLHDAANEKVFDTVIVVTDRTVLDDQLREAVKQIQRRDGMVVSIESGAGAKSERLLEALTGNSMIITVTLQTFPFVLDAIREQKGLQGRTFAVIADEAHSSQTGQAAANLRKVLTAQEIADLEDGGEFDTEAYLLAEATAKANTNNISFLAFTATPKPKTMEMFGTPDARGIPQPFHTYTMAQAIEEGFILDVLQNYTTYKTAFELARRVENGEMQPLTCTDDNGDLVDEAAATKGLMRWVKLHPTNIAQKVQIIIEHFEANVKHLLDGRAKAMVVTDSRKAAVRYKVALDKYIAEQGYDDYTALVAFSGEVTDEETPGGPFTETNMNPGVRDLRTAFDADRYRVMIVANKFQTGFDQPLLCAMYVDKQLSGIAAVQTLSRLNRAYPGKSTMVLDFVNDENEILAAFKQFYAEAEIEGTTDPNLVHDLQTKLDTTGMYTLDEVDTVVEAFVRGKGNNALSGALQPVKYRYVTGYQAALAANDKALQEEHLQFRHDVTAYIRLHDFLSQIIDFGDSDVEKHAIFFRLLQPHLSVDEGPADRVDLSEVELLAITQRHTGQHTLRLGGKGDPMKPITGTGTRQLRDPKLALLSEIIDRLNAIFAGEGFRHDQVESWANAIVEAMSIDEELAQQAKANTLPQFLASPTLRMRIIIAIAETREAHARMADLFNEKGNINTEVTDAIGKVLYQRLHQ